MVYRRDLLKGGGAILLRPRKSTSTRDFFTPAITASQEVPKMGEGFVARGSYHLDQENMWCQGVAVVRMGSDMTRGAGFLLASLPKSVDLELDPYVMIGSSTIGFEGGIHHQCMIHGSGGIDDTFVVFTPHEGLFLSEKNPYPNLKIENIHYTFGYYYKEVSYSLYG